MLFFFIKLLSKFFRLFFKQTIKNESKNFLSFFVFQKIEFFSFKLKFLNIFLWQKIVIEK